MAVQPPQQPAQQGPPPASWYPDPSAQGQLRYWNGAQWTGEVRRIPSPAEVMLVTSNELPGYEITDVIGEVFGMSVRTPDVFSNIGAQFRALGGGEVASYTRLLLEGRYEALERLKVEATQRGGNAVVALRFDSGELVQTINEVVAYGTAVIVRKLGQPR